MPPSAGPRRASLTHSDKKNRATEKRDEAVVIFRKYDPLYLGVDLIDLADKLDVMETGKERSKVTRGLLA